MEVVAYDNKKHNSTSSLPWHMAFTTCCLPVFELCRALAWRLRRMTSRRTPLLKTWVSSMSALNVYYAACLSLQGIGMEVVAYDIQKHPAVEAMGVKYVSIEP
jgi:hypothetical protein